MTASILEIAKLLLGAYFAFARLNGVTEEEIKKLYDDEKKKFEMNSPDKLENV